MMKLPKWLLRIGFRHVGFREVSGSILLLFRRTACQQDTAHQADPQHPVDRADRREKGETQRHDLCLIAFLSN